MAAQSAAVSGGEGAGHLHPHPLTHVCHFCPVPDSPMQGGWDMLGLCLVQCRVLGNFLACLACLGLGARHEGSGVKWLGPERVVHPSKARGRKKFGGRDPERRGEAYRLPRLRLSVSPSLRWVSLREGRGARRWSRQAVPLRLCTACNLLHEDGTPVLPMALSHLVRSELH